jgi:uncharacterized protein
MKSLRQWCAAVAFVLISAWAIGAELGESKDAGVIGEREDGYLGYVTETPAKDVVELVQGINDQRRAEYERIAAANGITREQVEALAGKKAIEKTAAGVFIFVGGEWQRKP